MNRPKAQILCRPTTALAKLPKVRGFVEAYNTITSDVLELDGELHENRPPGCMRFASPQGREEYIKICLYEIRPPLKSGSRCFTTGPPAQEAHWR